MHKYVPTYFGLFAKRYVSLLKNQEITNTDTDQHFFLAHWFSSTAHESSLWLRVYVVAVSVFVNCYMRSQIWTQVSTLRVEANLDLKRSWSKYYNLLRLISYYFVNTFLQLSQLFSLKLCLLWSTFLLIKPCHTKHRQKPPQRSISVFLCSAGCQN